MSTLRFAIGTIAVCAIGAMIPEALGDPLGTEFTYQAQLKLGGAPLNNTADFEFLLWDERGVGQPPAGGNQIGATQTVREVRVVDGLFTVQLNAAGEFGPDALNGDRRWIQIALRSPHDPDDTEPFTTLSPRQPLTGVPYALFALTGNEGPEGPSGAEGPEGPPGDSHWLLNETDTYYTAGNVGIGTTTPQATLHATSEALIDTIFAYSENRSAVVGRSNYVNGVGIWGRNDISNNLGYLGSTQYGVYGQATDLGNDWAGYFVGRAHVSDRLFVGREDPITVTEYFGVNAPVNSGYGGMYVSTNGNDAWPFYGYAAGGNTDMWHYYKGSTGKWHLHNGGFDRLTVQSDGNVGIGTTGPAAKLQVVSSTAHQAVRATSSIGEGGSVGVFAESTAVAGTGIIAIADTGSDAYGVWGLSADGLAGKFNGDVSISGTLSKSAGSFKIDHPLDPENKYLSHSFVESPDMMNIYNGNVFTDDSGSATVVLPEWFEALNRDFRYQLTVIDDTDSADFVLAKVVRRIRNNQFTIRTSAPHTEVSWQVTGIRQDPYAEANRIQVEEQKPERLRGLYRHPELFGRSSEYSEDSYKLMAMKQVTKSEPMEPDPNMQPQPNEATAARMGRTLTDPEPAAPPIPTGEAGEEGAR